MGHTELPRNISVDRARGGVRDLIPEPPSSSCNRQILCRFFRDKHGPDDETVHKPMRGNAIRMLGLGLDRDRQR